MSEHTPGPWHASRKSYYVNDIHNNVIAAVSRNKDLEANARLIAAAPDLLNALGELLDVIATVDRGWKDGNITILQQAVDATVFERAHAAMAAALASAQQRS